MVFPELLLVKVAVWLLQIVVPLTDGVDGGFATVSATVLVAEHPFAEAVKV